MSKINDKLLNAIKNYKVIAINIINDTNSEINKKVNKIFVINLLEDNLKRNYIICLMKKYKINYTLVIVERISSNLHKSICLNNSLISRSELGCCISHLWCLYQVLIHKYDNAIIFEDDIILHKNFTNLFLKIYKPSLHFLLLGAHDFQFMEENYKNVKNNLYRPNSNNKSQLYGAHSNYYSFKGAKRMFEIRMTEISFFDKEYMLMFDYYKDSSYICYPNLCVANITDSTLNHKREILSNTEYQYYLKCFTHFNFTNYNFMYINLLSENIKVIENDNYETYIDKCLYEHFHDFDSINLIKKRLTMDFFTIKDILTIINYNKNISDYIKSSEKVSLLGRL
jgi:GR25 family glycosyltransferase involved in LPS biosynthesis